MRTRHVILVPLLFAGVVGTALLARPAVRVTRPPRAMPVPPPVVRPDPPVPADLAWRWSPPALSARDLVQEGRDLLAEVRARVAEWERMEARIADLVRELKRVQAGCAFDGPTLDNAPPLRNIEGTVTACDDEIGMVVLSLGRSHGVHEGNEFTVYRGGSFVAKVRITKVDAAWSAGRVTLKKEAPQVGDDVSNHIFVSTPNK